MPLGHPIRLALVQFAPQPGSRENNLSVAEALVGDKKADIFLFPHLFSTAAGVDEAARFAERADGLTPTFLRKVALSRKAYVMGSYLAEGKIKKKNPFVRNLVIDPSGRTIATYDAIHLCSILGEPAHLSSGKKLPFFDLLTFRSALISSYDLRFPEIAREFGLSNGFLLFVAGAYRRSERMAWDSLLSARAVENQMFVVGCNFGASPNEKIDTSESSHDPFGGGSAVYAPDGRKIHQAGLGDQVLILDIDPFDVEWARTRYQYLTDAKSTVKRRHIHESPLDKE